MSSEEHDRTADHAEVFQGADGGWYVRTVSENGRIILRSEGYENEDWARSIAGQHGAAGAGRPGRAGDHDRRGGGTARSLSESPGVPVHSRELERRRRIGIRVLKRAGENGDSLVEAGTHEAEDAETAIQHAAGDTLGTYIAVPARSWTEITGEPDNAPRVVWTRATA